MLLEQGGQGASALDPDVLLDQFAVRSEDDERGRRRREDLVAEGRRKRARDVRRGHDEVPWEALAPGVRREVLGTLIGVDVEADVDDAGRGDLFERRLCFALLNSTIRTPDRHRLDRDDL